MSRFLVAFLLFTTASTAYAAESHWIGSNNALSTEWINPANWSATKGGATANALPTPDDRVFFDVGGGNVFLKGGEEILGLTLSSVWTGSVNIGTGWIVVGGNGVSVQSGRLISTYTDGNDTMTGAIMSTGSYIQSGGIVRIRHLFLSGSFLFTRDGEGADEFSFTSTGTITFNHATADQNFTVQKTATGTFSVSGITLNLKGGTTVDDLIVNMSGGLSMSGVLQITQGNLDLSTRAMPMVIDRGSLNIGNNADASLTTNKNVTLTGAITIGAAGVLSASSGTWTITNTTSKPFDLSDQSLPTVVLEGAGAKVMVSSLNLSGSLTINAGLLDMTTNSVIFYQDSGNITLANTAGVQLKTNSNVFSTGSISIGDAADLIVTAGTWTITNKAQQTADFDGQGLNALTKAGSGNLVIVATSGVSLTGALTINEGTFDLRTNEEDMTASGGITLANDAQAHLTASGFTLSGNFIVGANAVLNITGGVITLNDDGEQILDLDDQELNSVTIDRAPGVLLEDANIIAASAIVFSGALLVKNGEFRLGGFALSVSGALTIANDVDADVYSTGSLNLGGNLTMHTLGGGLLLTGATVTFNGRGNQTIQVITNRTLSVASGGVVINNVGGGTSDNVIMSGAQALPLALSGLLTITLGNLDLSTFSQTLLLDRGLTIANAAQASLTSDSNVTASGTISVGTSGIVTATGGTWTFVDNGAQVVGMAGNELNNVTFNLVPALVGDDQVIMTSAFTATGTVTITRGDVNMGGKALNISGSLIIANAGTATLTATGAVTFGSGTDLGTAGGLMLTGAQLTLEGIDQYLTIRRQSVAQETVTTNGAYVRDLTVKASSGVTLLSRLVVPGTFQINTGSLLALHGGHIIFGTGGIFINYATFREGTGALINTGSSFVLTDSSFSPLNELKTSETAYFTLTDPDENLDGTAKDTLTITVATVAGDSETVTLTESTNFSGVFRGNIASEKATVVKSDSKLQATADTTINITYTDAQDGFSNTDSALFTVVASSTTTTSGGGGGGGRGSGGGGGGGTATTLTTVLTKAQQEKKSEEEKAAFIAETLPAVRGLLSVEVAGKDITFKDVPVGQWFAQYVFKLVKTGVASGYKDARGRLTGEYGAGNPVTYAEIAKMALEAADKDESAVQGQPKNRTARREWSEKYIKLAEDTGLSVYGATLNVNMPATRGAVVQTILEAANIEIGDMAPDYKDVRASNTYAPAIAKATELGIVSGDTDRKGNLKGTFRPNDSVNRAETAKIMSKLLELLGK